MNHAPGDEKQASDFLNKSRMTREAMADVLTNRVLDHQAVQEWTDSLSTNTPLKVPALSTLSPDHLGENMKPTPGPENKYWRVTCQVADDGTGDLIVPIPEDLLKAMELAEGDTLYIVEAYTGTHKGFVLSKTERIPDRVDELVEHFDSKDG